MINYQTVKSLTMFTISVKDTTIYKHKLFANQLQSKHSSKNNKIRKKNISKMQKETDQKSNPPASSNPASYPVS